VTNKNLNRRELLQRAGAFGLGAATTALSSRAALAVSGEPGSTKMIDELTAEQREHAERMLQLTDQREKYFLDTIEKYNDSREVETRVFDFEKARHKVSVARGEVLEKAAWYTNQTKMADPPYIPEAVWDQYFELDFHPRTPLLGQLHATVYFTYLVDGSSAIAGYMDYTPGTWIGEDIAYMKQAVDKVFEQHGHDVERYRQMLYKDYHKDKLQAACIGAAFYVRPMLEINEVNLHFVKTAHETFVSAYFDVLDRRKDQSFAEEDLANQAGMRKRWLEDHLFSDPFTMHVVPYEVWSFADAPPVVRF
jgi:coproporphyrinogen III oxidase